MRKLPRDSSTLALKRAYCTQICPIASPCQVGQLACRGLLLRSERLTTNTATDGAPAWSPDGRSIAFMSDRDGNLEIYVMQADGTGTTRLFVNPLGYGDFAWSPYGQSIAFISDRDGNWEMYVMQADGTGATRLTTNPAAEWYPAWSP